MDRRPAPLSSSQAKLGIDARVDNYYALAARDHDEGPARTWPLYVEPGDVDTLGAEEFYGGRNRGIEPRLGARGQPFKSGGPRGVHSRIHETTFILGQPSVGGLAGSSALPFMPAIFTRSTPASSYPRLISLTRPLRAASALAARPRTCTLPSGGTRRTSVSRACSGAPRRRGGHRGAP